MRVLRGITRLWAVSLFTRVARVARVQEGGELIEFFRQVGDEGFCQDGIDRSIHPLLSATLFVLDLLLVRTFCEITFPVAFGASIRPLRFYPMTVEETAILEPLQIADDGCEEDGVSSGQESNALSISSSFVKIRSLAF